MKFVVKKRGKGLLFGHLEEEKTVCTTETWGEAYTIAHNSNKMDCNHYYWITDDRT